MMRRAAALLVLALPTLAAAGPPTLVEEGERWWTTSPDPRNPVACATCHHDPEATRGWAASFPKFKPLPPPHARVMTLLQANAEAVARHYRLSDPLPVATAISAYLAAHGTGVPRSPGISAGQPVFPERLRALAESAARGARLFRRRCASCHAAAAVAAASLAFPRRVGDRAEALEVYVEGHRAAGPRIAWNSHRMADLSAFLADRLAPRLLVLAVSPIREDPR